MASIRFFCNRCNISFRTRVEDWPISCACGRTFVLLSDGSFMTTEELLEPAKVNKEIYSHLAKQTIGGVVNAAKIRDKVVLNYQNPQRTKVHVKPNRVDNTAVVKDTGLSIDKVAVIYNAVSFEDAYEFVESMRTYYPRQSVSIVVKGSVSSNLHHDTTYKNVRHVFIPVEMQPLTILSYLKLSITLPFVLFVNRGVRFNEFSKIENLLTYVNRALPGDISRHNYIRPEFISPVFRTTDGYIINHPFGSEVLYNGKCVVLYKWVKGVPDAFLITRETITAIGSRNELAGIALSSCVFDILEKPQGDFIYDPVNTTFNVKHDHNNRYVLFTHNDLLLEGVSSLFNSFAKDESTALFELFPARTEQEVEQYLDRFAGKYLTLLYEDSLENTTAVKYWPWAKQRISSSKFFEMISSLDPLRA